MEKHFPRDVGGLAISGIRSAAERQVKGSPRQVLTFLMRSKGNVAQNGKDRLLVEG